MRDIIAACGGTNYGRGYWNSRRHSGVANLIAGEPRGRSEFFPALTAGSIYANL